MLKVMRPPSFAVGGNFESSSSFHLVLRQGLWNRSAWNVLQFTLSRLRNRGRVIHLSWLWWRMCAVHLNSLIECPVAPQINVDLVNVSTRQELSRRAYRRKRCRCWCVKALLPVHTCIGRSMIQRRRKQKRGENNKPWWVLSSRKKDQKTTTKRTRRRQQKPTTPIATKGKKQMTPKTKMTVSSTTPTCS